MTTLVAALALVAACSDESGDDEGLGGGSGDGPDGAALVEPFETEAEAAYEANDGDRLDDFNRGTTIDDGCFALDEAGAVAVTEALALDGAGDAGIADGTFLQGPPGQGETLSCGIDAGEDARIGVTVGTTTLERDQLLEQMELGAGQSDQELTEIDGEAPGLDADTVLAVDRDGFATFGWIDGDFTVALSFPEDLADYDRGFEALPVLVGAVADTLTGG